MLRTLFLAFCLFGVVLGLALWLLRGVIGRRSSVRRIQRARAALAADRAELERQFFAAAATSGRPRGLTWKSCNFDPEPLLARDRSTGDIYALVRVTIGFEAIAGGDMELVEAVGNLRCATALFEWSDSAWTTHGRTIFNLEPSEAIEHFRKDLEAIHPPGITKSEQE